MFKEETEPDIYTLYESISNNNTNLMKKLFNDERIWLQNHPNYLFCYDKWDILYYACGNGQQESFSCLLDNYDWKLSVGEIYDNGYQGLDNIIGLVCDFDKLVILFKKMNEIGIKINPYYDLDYGFSNAIKAQDLRVIRLLYENQVPLDHNSIVELKCSTNKEILNFFSEMYNIDIDVDSDVNIKIRK